ncbi:MAG: hypothetical protein ACRC62_10165 [Microcoleus sp.]
MASSGVKWRQLPGLPKSSKWCGFRGISTQLTISAIEFPSAVNSQLSTLNSQLN